MEDMTALSVVNLLPSGREQVMAFTKTLKGEILANTHEPLRILTQLKYIEKVLENILTDKDIEWHFLREFELYGKEKVVDINGAKLSTMEAGVKYAYDECGDPVWMDLNKQIAELTAKRKEREEFLKVIPEGGTVDPDTGVFITRPPKSSKTKVSVRI